MCKAIVSSLQYWFVVLGDLATCSNTRSMSSCASAYVTAWDSFSAECWLTVWSFRIPSFHQMPTTLRRPESCTSLRMPAYTHTRKHSQHYGWMEGVIRFTILGFATNSLFWWLLAWQQLSLKTSWHHSWQVYFCSSLQKPELVCYLLLLVSGRLY